MKAIIPMAGKGTRLRPHTFQTPKPLLPVGGRPVMSYLLDDLQELGVEEIIFVVGYLQEVVRDYIASHYPGFKARFVVQEVQDGTAGAVKLAEPYADDDLLIIFVDTLFDADLGLARTLESQWSGVLWAKEVDDYQRFGVILTDEDGSMTRIVEKPKEPISRLANIGLYYIRDTALLFEGINHVLAGGTGASGEYYLTDAFQYMVDQGAKLRTAPVAGWYDCGKPETLLETNHHLLRTTRGGVHPEARVEASEMNGAVRIEEGVVIEGSRIGPNVTLGRGCRVVNATLRDVMVGEDAVLENVELHDSLLGDRVRMEGVSGSVSLASDSYLVP